MENIDLSKPWYEMFVKSGSEERIKRDLHGRFNSDLSFHVPKKLMKERKGGKWHKKIRPLFPGYILINGEITDDSYYRLREVLDIYFVLKDGYKPSPIIEQEIKPILHLMNLGDDGVIGVSDIIIKGDEVFVKSGPLMTFEGQITSINHRKGRAKVRFFISDQERIVELAVNVLSKS